MYLKERSSRRFHVEEEGNGMTEAMCYTIDFGDARKGHKPRNARNAALEAGNGKGMDSPLELSGRTQLDEHIDFDPAKPILEF